MMGSLIQDMINYLGLEKHEQFFTVFFIFLCLLLAIILMLIMNRYFKNDASSIYQFYKNSSNELYNETDKIKKMLKELNKMTDDLNGIITYTNASIEARKQIIDALQQKINSLSTDENRLSEKINTLNTLKDKQIVINDIINDFFKKNNKNSLLLNIIIGFVFCILGYVLSKVF